MHRNSFDAPSRLTSVFHGSSFSCVAFGSGLLVKVWFVFIVLALEVTSWIPSMFLVFSSIIYTKVAKVLPRLHTKQVISHFFLQLVSQDSAQELFERTIPPYLGVSRIEFQFCLWTRFVSQGMVCLHCVGFGGSWTFTVIFFNVSRGSPLFVSLYISFA